MKKKYTLFITFCLIIVISSFNLSAKTGWYKVPVPTNKNITNISFYDSRFGVVVNSYQELYLTKNGGNNFENMTINLPQFIGVFFNVKVIKPDEIYLLVYKSIFLSRDSCKNWQRIIPVVNKKDTLTCLEFSKENKEYKCISWSNVFSSFSNINVWYLKFNFEHVFNPNYANCDNYYYPLSYLNDLVFGRQITKLSGTITYYFQYYFNNEIIYDIDLPFDFYSYYNEIIQINGNELLMNSDEGIYKSIDSSQTWIKILDRTSFQNMYKINDNAFYMTKFNRFATPNPSKIVILKNLEIINCKIDFLLEDKIKKIFVVSPNDAFALLDSLEDSTHITNYFLKTEDGGGVDLSDVEQEEITNPQIEFSTDLQLYDMLGRQIATYDNYYKLKTEIANFTPPHLIKWRDASGVYHFEKFK